MNRIFNSLTPPHFCAFSNQDMRDGILFTGLAPPHYCVCPKLRPLFPTSYVGIFFFVVQRVQLYVAECFVDIGGIDDNHCLNVLFIIICTTEFNRCDVHVCHTVLHTVTSCSIYQLYLIVIATRRLANHNRKLSGCGVCVIFRYIPRLCSIFTLGKRG